LGWKPLEEIIRMKSKSIRCSTPCIKKKFNRLYNVVPYLPLVIMRWTTLTWLSFPFWFQRCWGLRLQVVVVPILQKRPMETGRLSRLRFEITRSNIWFVRKYLLDKRSRLTVQAGNRRDIEQLAASLTNTQPCFDAALPQVHWSAREQRSIVFHTITLA
jgi:hypothetical protein